MQEKAVGEKTEMKQNIRDQLRRVAAAGCQHLSSIHWRPLPCPIETPTNMGWGCSR